MCRMSDSLPMPVVTGVLTSAIRSRFDRLDVSELLVGLSVYEGQKVLDMGGLSDDRGMCRFPCWDIGARL